MSKIRESTGGAYESRGRFYMRVTVAAQQRRAELLPWCTSLDDANARANVVQGFVSRLRAAGQVDFVEKVIEIGATADAEKLEALGRKVDAIAGGDFERVKPKGEGKAADTFEGFALRWTSGELHRLYPDHVGTKDSADDEYRLAVLNEIVGDVPLARLNHRRC